MRLALLSYKKNHVNIENERVVLRQIDALLPLRLI